MIPKEALDRLEAQAHSIQGCRSDLPVMDCPAIVILQFITAARELDSTHKENDILRGIAATIMPCHYCGVNEIAKCPRGFPGCGLADDLFCAEEALVHEYRKELESVKAELKKVIGLLDVSGFDEWWKYQAFDRWDDSEVAARSAWNSAIESVKKSTPSPSSRPGAAQTQVESSQAVQREPKD